MDDLTTAATAAAVFCMLPRYRKKAPWGMQAVVWLMLAAATGAALVSLVTPVLPLSLALGLNQVLAVLFPALLLLRIKRQGFKDGLRLRWPGGTPLLFAAMLGSGLVAVSAVLASLVSPWLGEFPAEILAMYPKTWQELGPLWIVGALGAGICEEIMFRGAIQGVLSRRSMAEAVVITALLFGLFHLNMWQFIAGTAAGLLMGWVVERSGSLLTAMAVHTTTNTIALSYPVLSGKMPTTELEVVPTVSFLVVGLVGLAGFIRTTGGIIPIPSPLRQLSTTVSWKVWTLLVITLSAVCVLSITAHLGWWGLGKLGFDFPVFGVTRESNVLFVDPRRFPRTLKPGDRVFFQKEGEAMAGVVARIDFEWVTVSMEGGEVSARREDVYFKLVWANHALSAHSP